MIEYIFNSVEHSFTLVHVSTRADVLARVLFYNPLFVIFYLQHTKPHIGKSWASTDVENIIRRNKVGLYLYHIMCVFEQFLMWFDASSFIKFYICCFCCYLFFFFFFFIFCFGFKIVRNIFWTFAFTALKIFCM